MTTRARFLASATVAMMSAAVAPAQDNDLTLEALRTQRRDLAFRDRGIICNNDGCDALYYPENQEVTPEGFLNLRTTALADTQVGAIAYCTISSGFSFFTHDTEIGTVLTRQPQDYNIGRGKRNITQDLIDQGADCLKLVVDYAHAHDMEAFWSFRMNDTHDVSYRPDKPYLLYPPLKEEHPDWLVGDEVGKGTAKGRWSSVNYALPEIRDLAFRFAEEVCRNYDVDGIELDYFRHMCYFPSVANGGTASDEERAMMTDLMRRIRRMTEQVGLQKGRPILVAIRVADDTGFNRDMGLDVETWLEEGLVDILETTGYFRLNPWQTTVELAHKYQVAAYPCLSDSRIRGSSRFNRRSTETYRGRAANAWLAGADGIHLFNYFDPRADLWSEVGSADSLVGLDKIYFVTMRDGNPASWLADANQYATLPVLTPSQPLQLDPDTPASTTMVIGENLAAARQKGLDAAVTAHMQLTGVDDPSRVTVRLNGHTLQQANRVDDWVDFTVQPAWLTRGNNRFEFSLNPVQRATGAEPTWTKTYEANEVPGGSWSQDRPATNTVAEVQDGVLLLADRGENSGDYRYYRYAWGMGSKNQAVIETRIKVLSGVNCLIFGNGGAGERVRMYPDRMTLHHNKDISAQIDLSDDFHVVRVVVDGEDVQVFVDGELTLDGKGAFSGDRRYGNSIAFGGASSTELGEALWDYVRVSIDSAVVSDLAVSVSYSE